MKKRSELYSMVMDILSIPFELIMAIPAIVWFLLVGCFFVGFSILAIALSPLVLLCGGTVKVGSIKISLRSKK